MLASTEANKKRTEQGAQKFLTFPGLEYDKGGRLCFMGESIAALAENFGTPLYVYSADLIRSNIKRLRSALGPIQHLICYAVKANSNLGILRLMQEEDCGVDIVSGGELYRAKRAQVSPQKIVFSGTGKTVQELKDALEAGILLFSVESEAELGTLADLSESLGLRAKVSLRVNPALALQGQSHPYITTGQEHDKFGIPSHQILDIYKRASARKGINICSLGIHIGSQILDPNFFIMAAEALSQTLLRLEGEGFQADYIDFGGGLGISYDGIEEELSPLSLKSYVENITKHIKLKGKTLILEPGRFLVGNAGILITQMILKKSNGKKNFYVVDAAMNDLMRPALYQARHRILPYRKEMLASTSSLSLDADMVGPVCESGDFFARGVPLADFASGDYAVICSAGAYGFSMSSNYNSRCRAAEVLLREGKASLIRQREKYEDLTRLEEL